MDRPLCDKGTTSPDKHRPTGNSTDFNTYPQEVAGVAVSWALSCRCIAATQCYMTICPDVCGPVRIVWPHDLECNTKCQKKYHGLHGACTAGRLEASRALIL